MTRADKRRALHALIGNLLLIGAVFLLVGLDYWDYVAPWK